MKIWHMQQNHQKIILLLALVKLDIFNLKQSLNIKQVLKLKTEQNLFTVTFGITNHSPLNNLLKSPVYALMY